MVKAAQINFKNVPLTTAQKIVGYTALEVTHIRFSITTTTWTGQNVNLEQFIAAGFRILLNVGYNSTTPAPYCTDIPAYINALDEILTLYGSYCDLVVIENEEPNSTYFTDPYLNYSVYLAQLAAAIPVVHSHGLPVMNGGITTRSMTLYMYRYYVSKGLVAKADLFASRNIPDRFLNALQNPGVNAAVDNQVSLIGNLLNAYKNLNLDFVNWHIYEPVKLRGEVDAYALSAGTTTTSRSFICQCSSVIKKVTGKQAISNEVGQLNDSGLLTTSVLAALKKANYPYISYYAGDGDVDDVRGLVNEDMTIRTSGTAFKNFV